MKKLIVTAFMAIIYGGATAQTPGTSYTNSAPSSIPGQPAELYNGTNPAGMPNQTPATPPPPTSSDTYSSPASPNGSYQSTPPSGTNPTSPNIPSQTNPPFPSSQGTYSPNKTQRLFQDPMKTPKSPNQSDPVPTADGSTGKYKSHHKTSTGKDFATKKRHIKTAKPHDKHIKDSKDNTESTR